MPKIIVIGLIVKVIVENVVTFLGGHSVCYMLSRAKNDQLHRASRTGHHSDREFVIRSLYNLQRAQCLSFSWQSRRRG